MHGVFLLIAITIRTRESKVKKVVLVEEAGTPEALLWITELLNQTKNYVVYS